jgi:CDP-glucose 4,6-dehydratase
MFGNIYRGRRVLVTGHTGFKGSWLVAWLLQLGAEVAGYSDGVPTAPSHFAAAGLQPRITHFFGDVRDRARLEATFDEFRPECVFHLAAQALVRRSYAEPALTFETNALGTMNLLECARRRSFVRAIVLITSDKAYRNVEWVWGYRETDALGGDDPYSGSKAAAEMIANAYARSFFLPTADLAAIATTRAGNVIGGGDWAPDRIVPDCIRAWSERRPVVIRHPRATRPWQHVLEPLSGYLTLGMFLWRRDQVAMGSAYNFGPDATVDHPVQNLIECLGRHWPGAEWTLDPLGLVGRPEATLLKLSCDRAQADLRWRAVLAFDDCVRFTGEWYRQYYEDPAAGPECTRQQIEEYTSRAAAQGLAWSRP